MEKMLTAEQYHVTREQERKDPLRMLTIIIMKKVHTNALVVIRCYLAAIINLKAVQDGQALMTK